jgi:hypothetical protein
MKEALVCVRKALSCRFEVQEIDSTDRSLDEVQQKES